MNKSANKKTLLIAGHDFKFINSLSFSNFNVIYDKWTGHTKHNEKESITKLKQSDIIICEWFLGNAVWYSHNKMNHHKLFVRLHRVESNTRYINDANINNIDNIFFVSNSWIVQHFYIHANLFKNYSLMPNNLSNYFKPDETRLKQKLKYKETKEINIGICGILPFSLKNPHGVKAVIDLLKKSYNIVFHIYGKLPTELLWTIKKEPNSINEYNELLSYLKKNTKLIIHSFTSNNKLYNEFFKLDIILITSNVESFHKSALEALMAGVLPIFIGEYVTKYNCKMNWCNDFCFENITECISYINWYIKSKTKYLYLYPIINKNFKKYCNLNIEKNINLIINNKTEQSILVCINCNLKYMDGSITFLNNLLKTLIEQNQNIILVLPHQNNDIHIYKDRLYNIDNIHLYTMLESEQIQDVIIKYKLINIKKYFIRGFDINITSFTKDIQKKIIFYCINKITHLPSKLTTYITQTDYMKKNYLQYNIKYILYPTCLSGCERVKNKINILYVGTLRSEFSSESVLLLLIKLGQYKNVNVKVCISKIHGCVDYKNKIKILLSNPILDIHYNVNAKRIPEYLLWATYGINFKNVNDTQKGEISTKIIEYISYNIKPIINTSCDERILFKNEYPFIVGDTYNINNIYNMLYKYKMTHIKDMLNQSESNKYSLSNYKNNISTIFEIL